MRESQRSRKQLQEASTQQHTCTSHTQAMQVLYGGQHPPSPKEASPLRTGPPSKLGPEDQENEKNCL